MSLGVLRVYLGAAPGVGKTYSMLTEAHRRSGRGQKVVIGVIETHSRPALEPLLAGVEQIPLLPVVNESGEFLELNVPAVIARKPDLVLVDSFAHTNAVGSARRKRWEDIAELLDAGIDVISSINIQNVQSLSDIVTQITGVREPETVPDSVLRSATQIEMCDMAPMALRRRLAHGNIYRAEEIDTELGNYFRIANLTALREITLLWLADRVDETLEQYRTEEGIHDAWAARQRVIVALNGDETGEILLRRVAAQRKRMTARDLVAINVISSGVESASEPDAIAHLRLLTEQLGGTFHTIVGDEPAQVILEFARAANASRVVVGVRRRSALTRLLRRSTAEQIIRGAGPIDVQVVTTFDAESTKGARPRKLPPRRVMLGLLAAVVLPVVITAVLLIIRGNVTHLGTALLLLLFAVMMSSLIGGLKPAIVSAVMSVILTDLCFVQPYGSLLITAQENIFPLLSFLFVSVTIGFIVDRSASLASDAAARKAEAAALESLSFGVFRRRENMVRALLNQACDTFGMTSATLFEENPSTKQQVVVESVGTHPAATPDEADVFFEASVGLTLGLKGRVLPIAERRILRAYAAQAGAALERDRLAEQAAHAARLEDAAEARTALLNAVSHDLRTPLAGIKAALDTLSDPTLPLAEEDRRALLDDAAHGADRLNSLITNLLDMNRLNAGAVTPVIAPTVIDEVVQHALANVSRERIAEDVAEDLPVILTDAGLLERILANMIENAVRQQSGGEPVRISGGVVGGEHPAVLIRIADRGPGVAESQRKTMFEAFNQLGDSKKPSAGSVGLGLAVAGRLAALIGASIEPEDTPGGGLTMSVYLPLEVAGDADDTIAEDGGLL